ncbi:hypothetical protein DAPPUDRAFT_253820 [Daphnia pulex]|uniref:Uncharacterized protein n=1 Tax=Daphnia pulex TaxID=6669 RepID=E9H5H9_DAPPU|nr:hypothetical protein DAPPUDRAFT_253820 [Daphnia pulex]|eukprot:EFX72996.1 hypothetical protein DAPPUDRAFT_253820 [Daphnia pulex]
MLRIIRASAIAYVLSSDVRICISNCGTAYVSFGTNFAEQHSVWIYFKSVPAAV